MSKQHVLIIQKDLNKNDNADNSNSISYISLNHPKHNQLAIFLYDDQYIYELQQCNSRSYGSWFVNQRITSNSSMYLSNRIDPKFLLLPYLRKCSQTYSPLDQIVSSHSVNDSDRLPLQLSKHWNLHLICDINDKFGENIILYKYNESKTLNWLKHKYDKLMIVLNKQMNHNNKESFTMAKGFNVYAQSSQPINDNNKNDLNDDFPEEIVQSGIQILCEYIDDELSHKFIEFIGKDSSILVSKLKPATKRKSDWENELEIEKQTMSFASGKSTSNNSSNNTIVTKTNSSSSNNNKKQAKTLKPLTGMKSITSFFNKK